MFLRMFWRVMLGASLLFLITTVPGTTSTVLASAHEQQEAGPIPSATQFIVTQVVMTPPSPNILPNGQLVNFTFNYRVSYPAGVRIFTRPFSGNALSPNYGANPSGIYPTGSGIASGFFTISAGETVVDQVRIEIEAADTGAVLADYFLPVHYQFSSAADMPYEISLTPQTPNILMNGQNVTINYHFKSSFMGGVRIFPRPMSGGNLTPGYGASGSGLYTGTGTTSDFFNISSGTPVVDQIRFEVTSADQSVLLGAFYLPVNYQVTNATTAVNGISLTLLSPNPNILDNNQNVSLTFNYTTNNPGNVVIFARPFSLGALSMNYAASGSPLYPTGSGSGSGTFTISSGTELVDGIRFQVLNANQSVLLFEKVIPVYYLFGGEVFRLYGPYMTK